MTKIMLGFPPGWTFAPGGPHPALPMLKSYLEHRGVEACVVDINWLAGAGLNAFVSAESARAAASGSDLKRMNEPYFAVEDRLQDIARRFEGDWNLQAGFEYSDRPQDSAARALSALDRPTPYGGAFDIFIDAVERYRPDLIGLSIAASQQLIPALQLSARLRARGYDRFIALGGNTISRLADEMADPRLFDIVDGLITFQGEAALLELCKAIGGTRDLSGVPQLIWRDRGCVRRNVVETSFSPDSVQTPDYGGLPIGRYAGENYLAIIGARGCYYGRCTFCAIPFGWGNGGYAGARSVDFVFEDMCTLSARHGVNRFKFADEALSPHFMRELATRIVQAGAPFEWEGYTRLEAAWTTPTFVELVARGGFKKGWFGLELAPSDERSALNKKDSASPARIIELCAASGVKAHLFCMFGYPGTGETEAKRTVDFVLSHLEQIDTADVFPWTLAKHTNVPDVLKKASADDNWRLEFEHMATASDVLSSTEVKALAERCEDELWRAAPRLLHPTYRMISPWSDWPGSRETRIETGAAAYV